MGTTGAIAAFGSVAHPTHGLRKSCSQHSMPAPASRPAPQTCTPHCNPRFTQPHEDCGLSPMSSRDVWSARGAGQPAAAKGGARERGGRAGGQGRRHGRRRDRPRPRRPRVRPHRRGMRLWPLSVMRRVSGSRRRERSKAHCVGAGDAISLHCTALLCFAAVLLLCGSHWATSFSRRTTAPCRLPSPHTTCQRRTSHHIALPPTGRDAQV